WSNGYVMNLGSNGMSGRLLQNLTRQTTPDLRASAGPGAGPGPTPGAAQGPALPAQAATAQAQDFDPVQRFRLLLPQLKESLQVGGVCRRE
uniref:Uncharacterized protein n=1 Tax=Junco hyemalis TaxID=40217 RepID=A0A8C5NSN9_JUNHY